MHLAVVGAILIRFKVELLLGKFVLMDELAYACVQEVEQVLRGSLAVRLWTAQDAETALLLC